MRTQEPKAYIIDDLIQELDNLKISFGWKGMDLHRTDFSLVRKDVISTIYEIVLEARQQLERKSEAA